MTTRLRCDFANMCELARATSKFKGITLDVVLVRGKSITTRVSVLGNAINRVMAEMWRKNGCNVRVLRIYDSGIVREQTAPKKDSHN